MVDVILVIAIVVLAASEWNYRRKRDGVKEANRSFIFGGIVLATGLLAQHFFGMAGLFGLMAVMLTALLVMMLIRSRKPNVKN